MKAAIEAEKKNRSSPNHELKVSSSSLSNSSPISRVLPKESAPVLFAYVIFEEIESKKAAEEFFRHKNLMMDSDKLTVSKAPSPNGILWENLATSNVSRFLRSTLVYVAIIVMLIVRFFLVYFLKKMFVSLPKRSECEKALAEELDPNNLSEL